MFVWGAAQRGDPGADQRDRHGDVPRRGADRARPASRQPAAAGSAPDAMSAPARRSRRARPWPTPRRVPFWLDDPAPPRPAARADRRRPTADLLVVGGGYSGLWTALLAKERDPGRDVVLLEAGALRLGGLRPQRRLLRRPASPTASPTALARWPDEMPTLRAAGPATTSTPSATRWREHGIDCDFERTGEIDVATEPYQVAELADAGRAWRAAGLRRRAARRGATRRQRSTRRPTSAGCGTAGVAMLDPARLAWGLRAACLELGVRIHEHTPVRGPGARRRRCALRTPTARSCGAGRRAGHQRLPAAAAPAAATSCRSTTTR